MCFSLCNALCGEHPESAGKSPQHPLQQPPGHDRSITHHHPIESYLLIFVRPVFPAAGNNPLPAFSLSTGYPAPVRYAHHRA